MLVPAARAPWWVLVAAITPVIVTVFPVAVVFVVLLVFMVTFFAEIGTVAVIGLGARLGLCHVFADGSPCGTPSTCTHDRAILATY